MENISKITKMKGVDIGYHQSNIHPPNGEGCVGKSGINKDYTFEMVLDLAYKMNPKPNIIIKGGKKAKWYLKRIPIETINDAIIKQNWRDTTRCTMYIIDW